MDESEDSGPPSRRTEKELVSTIAEGDSQHSRNSIQAENESGSTTTEEDLDPISAFMQLATEEVSSSKCKEITDRIVSSIATKEKDSSQNNDVELIETLIENESQSSACSSLGRNSNSTIVDETLVDQSELTEREFSMIIEEDPLREDLRIVKIRPPSPVSPAADHRYTSKTSEAKLPSSPKTLDNFITDSSTLLLDYELRIQGKYMCDVIEIPEHIFVITIPKAKALKLSNSNNWLNNEEKQVPRSLLDIPPDISISRTLSKGKGRRNIGRKPFQTENVDYVYYMGEDETPRRDREIQVDIEITKKEIGNQCDAEFDLSMVSGDSNQRCNVPADLNKRECLVCGEILLNYLAQLKHFALHDNSVPSLCSYCGVTYSSVAKLLAHEKYFHGKFMMDINEAMRCPRPYCNKAFYSKKQLHDHIEEHIGNISHKCYICLRTFNSSLQLFRHQRTSKFCLHRKVLKHNMFFRRMLEC